MNKKIIPIAIVVLLAIAVGAAYLWLSPTNYQEITSKNQQTSQPSQSSQTAQTSSLPSAVQAIKTYAAQQFKVTEGELTIINSAKQSWDDICLDIIIPSYPCPEEKLSGYEVTIETKGYKTIYRGTDDGSIIRVVK